MSSDRIESLIEAVQGAFDRPPTDIEAELAVDDAALLQLRKACRLLAGAEQLPVNSERVPPFTAGVNRVRSEVVTATLLLVLSLQRF